MTIAVDMGRKAPKTNKQDMSINASCLKCSGVVLFVCLFDLILYVPSTIFQL